MQRREFITLLGGAAATWPLAARAKRPTARVYRVGWLSIGSREQTLHFIEAFEEGLRSLGYRVGDNIVIEYRFADGEMERMPALAAELVRLGVDIITTGSNAVTAMAMKATATIPIVMTNSVDPVSAGLVASLARRKPYDRPNTTAMNSPSRRGGLVTLHSPCPGTGLLRPAREP